MLFDGIEGRGVILLWEPTGIGKEVGMKVDEEKLDTLCEGFKKNVLAGYRTKLDFNYSDNPSDGAVSLRCLDKEGYVGLLFLSDPQDYPLIFGHRKYFED